MRQGNIGFLPSRAATVWLLLKYCARVRRMLTGTRAAEVTRALRDLVNIIKLLNESRRADGGIRAPGPMRRKWRPRELTKPDWQVVTPMPCSSWPRNRATRTGLPRI